MNLPEREWSMSSVKGDRLSILIRELRPGTTYHFKLQAKNVKGYGPFSSLVNFTTPPAIRSMDFFPHDHNLAMNDTFYEQIIELLR